MPPSTSNKILIVDDNPINLDILYEQLTAAGYAVFVAEDGADALELAQQLRPKLILLDLMMPGIDGFETNRRLKALETTYDIPVIFLTALSDAAVKVKAFASGGVDYITKPFSAQEVLARVATHLQIHNLQNELQKRNQELGAFAHTVAHDLKSPLQMIMGFTELVQEQETLSPRSRQYLEIVVQTGDKMQRIIDGLLLLAEVERVEAILHPLDTAQVVKEAMKRLAHLLTEEAASIERPSAWPSALGYAAWVEEVWANYLHNAINYGGRPLHIQLGATPQADGMIRFWVRDNGDGIPPEQQAELFTEFTQLEGLKKAKSSGLGLSIVKRIVEKLGGQVGIESELGQGSTFYFTLPSVRDE